VTVVSHAFEANGLRLAVHDWGGDGPPALLAHPTGFHGRVWQPVATRLVAAGWRVWSFDFRGHGDSSAPAVMTFDYSWDGFADDVLAVAAHLDLAADPQLLAYGHSKGGAALLLGEALRPGTFPRIWAYEPIIFDHDEPRPPDSDFFLSRAARKRRNAWSSREEAFAAYASKPPLNVMTEESLRAYVDYGLRDRGDGVLELKCPPDVEAQVYAMGPNHDAFRKLPQIAAPVAVVCGAISTSIDSSRAKRIAERLPHGRVEVIPGVGHFGPQQDPDACVASIFRFTSGPVSH
jgi:pimeloyl-ACP methyl ester carboxylesterase